MSAPAAAATAAPEAPKKGKSKLMIIVIAAVVLAAGGGGGAWFLMNKKAHAEAADADEKPAETAKHAPTYMPMENMVVNLADDGGDRFAQIGITLQLEDDKTAEKIKAILPVIRSKMLVLVSQRSSSELLKRDGKEQLANDIVAEVSGALGYEVEAHDDKPAKAKAKAEDADEDEAPKKKKKKKAVAPSPVHGVLFSAFIVQ